MAEDQDNKENQDANVLQYLGAESPPWGTIWGSSELKSSWMQETPIDSAAELVRQLMLRQKPELATTLDTALLDLDSECFRGHISEHVEKGSTIMSNKLQELQEHKASLLQRLRDVDDEANSHKSTFLIRLNADGHAGELEKASSSETVKLPGEDEPCSFDTTPTLDAGGAFQTAIPNDPYCSCEGSVDGRRTVSCSEISPQSDSRQIVEGFGNHPGLEEDSLQVARLRLQNLQKQLDYLSELQSHLAHTSEGLRDALSSLHQEHSSRQSDLTVS